MNALQLPGQLREIPKRLRQARMWRDQLSIGLVVAALVFNGLTLIDLIIKVRPVDYQVPVHYSSLGGFDTLGGWYHPYTIAIFGLLVSLTNTALAGRAFGRSRVASFYLLLGSVVVTVFCLIIANAFSVVS